MLKIFVNTYSDPEWRHCHQLDTKRTVQQEKCGRKNTGKQQKCQEFQIKYQRLEKKPTLEFVYKQRGIIINCGRCQLKHLTWNWKSFVFLVITICHVLLGTGKSSLILYYTAIWWQKKHWPVVINKILISQCLVNVWHNKKNMKLSIAIQESELGGDESIFYLGGQYTCSWLQLMKKIDKINKMLL